MKEYKNWAKWTLHHTWVISVSYLISIIVLLSIHGSFGFTMNDEGTYLSNTLMHIGSGAILAFGTGILQKQLLQKHFRVSFNWVWALIIGFITAELLAGIVLWEMGIYRGLINIFNNLNHLPEAAIFAFAGLFSGILQFRLLRNYYKRRVYWIVASTFGWGILILSTYLGLFAFLLGAFFYGIITGFVFDFILIEKNQNKDGIKD